MTILRVLGCALLAAFATASASAGEDSAATDILPVQPVSWMFDNFELSAGGLAGGAVSYAWQQSGPNSPGGYNHAQASGELRPWLRIQRILDNGMVLGARTNLLLLHDQLSGDIYGSNFVERLFAYAQTGFGRFEIGQQDGAAYQVSLTGPEIDPLVSLEARKISLFRDPLTGRDFGRFFNQVTAVESTSNYPKINYLTPRIVGVQLGVSFTPNTERSPLPWTGNPGNNPTEQHNIWEVAAGYTGFVSGVAVGVSAGYAGGALRQATPLGDDLYDWSVGAELAYTLNGIKLTAGGAYRGTNAYLFDPHEVFRNAKSEGTHFSATAEQGPWRLGAETSNAHAAGPVDFGITGYQTTLGYQFTSALQLTGGWQRYDYSRNTGAFYNGRAATHMNAIYLAVAYIL
jgi:hypothetical protein